MQLISVQTHIMHIWALALVINQPPITHYIESLNANEWKRDNLNLPNTKVALLEKVSGPGFLHRRRGGDEGDLKDNIVI